MRQQFQGAYEACKRALAAQPILNEPVICISTVSQKTCDPCCLVMLYSLSQNFTTAGCAQGTAHLAWLREHLAVSIYLAFLDIQFFAEQRIQDQVQSWVKEGRWQELADEKREVLLHMQDVLRSCHTLLQTTQIPMNGVVNLLQHILK